MASLVVESPIGGIGIAAVDGAVVRISFGGSAVAGPGTDAGAERRRRTGPVADDGAAGHERSVAVLDEVARQVREFFAGTRTRFDVPLAVRGGSEFERAVWAAIAAIPYGETSSYGAIARTVGEPGGAQAVGLACNRNPLPIIVPCHRVIGSDGKLVGFGGGLHRKRWLLELEARISIERAFAGDPV